MNRAALWRALLALLGVGVTGVFAVTQEPRLGLDLRGASARGRPRRAPGAAHGQDSTCRDRM